MNGREQWSGRLGFILATLGSAVGLGNIWRFSYVAGENGGGAFLLVYIGAVLAVGLPLLLAELAMGRAAQGDVTRAFAHPAPRNPLRHVGLLAVAGSILILSYYSVIAGWTLRYLATYAGDLAAGRPAADAAADFAGFIADPLAPLAWHVAFMLLTILVTAGGIRRGIESANRVIMPLLGLTVIGLAAYALSLPGAGAGVAFLLMPDWSALGEPRVYLAALGQAFFSLGLAMGVLATYGGYLARGHRLPGAAVAITFGDVLFALVAGLAIFPAVFAFGMAPEQGPALAFVVLPEVFARMPAGVLFGFAFFALLALAALTSAISLLEVAVAWAMGLGLRRRTAVAGVGTLVLLLGIPSALSFGVLADVTLDGRGLLDAIDHMVSDYLLPIAGFGIAVIAGWLWRRDEALAEVELGPRLGRLWRLAVRYLAPAVIALILLRSLGLA